MSNRKKWSNSSNRLRRRQWNLLESSKPVETTQDSDTYYEGKNYKPDLLNIDCLMTKRMEIDCGRNLADH